MSNLGCGLPYLLYPLFTFHPFSKSPIFSQNFCSRHYKFTLKMFLCFFTIILADSLKGKGIICEFSLPSFFGKLLAYIRNSLVVQWSGLGTFIATGRGSHTHTQTHTHTHTHTHTEANISLFFKTMLICNLISLHLLLSLCPWLPRCFVKELSMLIPVTCSRSILSVPLLADIWRCQCT